MHHNFSKLISTLSVALLAAAALYASPITASAAAGQTSKLDGLEWRMIGPYRGGRVTAVTGVPGNPNLYYMGATGGGVWKTENAGGAWENISDGDFKVGTIGAVAVANSDHNVIYVGTGEAPIRGVTTSHGDGVWRSTDAGKTWSHLGLEKSGQISRIEIHPKNPDMAYVAVQGQIWGPNPERGVFRTTDGGENWEHVLKVSSNTGATDLSMDPTNPRILYAAMWNHGRKPWFIHSGGTDGGIYKSTDAGDSWAKLTGGLPEMIGKIGVDVSASNPERVYAIIEAEPEKGGLWRSDDAGETWTLINGHRVLHSRAWYYIHIAADPVDEDTVYVLNVPLMKSIDGGESWEKMTTPHGDHHDHWINPDDNRNMINGNDGGATITFDGGETWSSIMNQPTAQFYRVTTDNQVPFRIYGGQQDNTTMSIASRSLYGGIGVADYYDIGGGESAHIAFDPDDPRLIYATTINGTLTEYDHQTQLERSIIPYPEVVWGKDSRDLKYRTNWNAPVAVSPHDPSVIYYGTQMVLKSTDRGATWTEISPDLTRNDPEKQGRNGGPLTPENVGAEFYNTLFYIVESPLEKGHLWVGSDDGLVHLSRDGGDSWNNVSPPHKGEAMINAIEISPHAPGTVYLAVTAYKLNDFKPYIYKTTDYGKRWKRIDEGLPEDTFVRVVREDLSRKGQLYAGTEAGMFVSFSDGGDWQPLDLNLPPVPITDLTIRQDSLVAATQGRGFWTLDDLFMVRAAAEGLGEESVQLFAPGKTANMIKRGWSSEEFEAENPAGGVPLYYYLEEDIEGPLTLEILDSDGSLVRAYSSEESDFERCLLHNMDPRSPYEPEYPSARAGLNKWNWDTRRQGFTCVEDMTLFAGLAGASVAPGKYRARITAGSDQQEVSFELAADPRLSAMPDEIREWSARLDEASALLEDVLTGLAELRKSRAQIEVLKADYEQDSELQQSAQAALDAIDAWDHRIIQPLHETLEDEDAWETMLAGQIRFVLDVIDQTGAPVAEGTLLRLSDLKSEWAALQARRDAIRSDHIEPINSWAKRNDVPHVRGD
ncbi:MAG: glycosyl hydrolase [Xanthomonadales bacterium]|nr:glycosyl hydrolase [Gammaproteobacteria bacterium]MBT8054609.1 glycosyl hydrolase [Gammaproteobacteria bacterium]NND58111.1 glycosyl hydrolase [Xanthomonadales bacterium]NNK50384.1 glycosyl hydrolase [Xanthomonadales bacterium]